MKLWLISQDTNNEYDTYDSAVVAAPDAEAARLIHPGTVITYTWGDWRHAQGHPPQSPCWGYTADSGQSFIEGAYGSWTDPQNVSATLIGEAVEGTAPGTILASFNAG